jgi:dihydrofolate reductase
MKQMIFASALNGAFGLDLGLPWGPVPEDLATFKKLTQNTTLVMGRTTFESLPFSPTTNRPWVVVSSRLPRLSGNLINVLRPEELMLFLTNTSKDLSVIGGASLITSEIINLMDCVFHTLVEESPEADVFIPNSVIERLEYFPNKETVFSNSKGRMTKYYA